MPIYEYECPKHGRFEKIQKLRRIIGGHKAICPECFDVCKSVISPWGRVIFAGFDTVVAHDGKILSRKQSTEAIPSMPEPVHGSRF